MACLNCIPRNGRPAKDFCTPCAADETNTLWHKKERAVAALDVLWSKEFDKIRPLPQDAPVARRMGREWTEYQRKKQAKAYRQRMALKKGAKT